MKTSNARAVRPTPGGGGAARARSSERRSIGAGVVDGGARVAQRINERGTPNERRYRRARAFAMGGLYAKRSRSRKTERWELRGSRRRARPPGPFAT